MLPECSKLSETTEVPGEPTLLRMRAHLAQGGEWTGNNPSGCLLVVYCWVTKDHVGTFSRNGQNIGSSTDPDR